MKRNVTFPYICQGCSTQLKIEFIAEPTRTGAMWTVDCPVCGTGKMIPDQPVRMYYLKEGGWIEASARSHYFG